MLARRALQGLARPLTRLSSTSTPVPTPEVPAAAAAVPQAPNLATTWSTSQRPRPQPQSSPRFEQTIMELQPNPLSAMEMISREPIRVVNGRKAVCDGGGGPLGHPKIFINLSTNGMTVRIFYLSGGIPTYTPSDVDVPPRCRFVGSGRLFV
ncbi:Lactobacillus shifted protein [Trametes pubescens]|uniref:Lactobacillus shifted protein n=1 Tax=Trametes pubescens TaxID=154538 RepID=A0A1M2W7S2_TRAPU|nr:Lactobacillus shifted protein [Trametes pubescens]